MATAKKAPSKKVAAKKVMKAPAKAVKAVPAKKAAPLKKVAPVSKTAKAITKIGEKVAKLTDRKNAIATEIAALKDQRAQLKSGAVALAAASPKAKAPAKKKTSAK